MRDNWPLLCHNTGRLLMIVPTRGRPQNAEALMEACAIVAMRGDVGRLLFVADEDDPSLNDYLSLVPDNLHVGPRRRLGGTLNDVALRYASACDAIGFMGDDHLPRTQGFDIELMAELDRLGTGVVYGNDLIQGPNLPTAVAMTSDIIQTLGYMVPAGLVHMFADNAWKAWGEGIGRLSYLPDTIIEHVHPLAGKAEEDDGYREVAAYMDPDSQRWSDYQLMGGLAADVERLRAMINAKKPWGSTCPQGHELAGEHSTYQKLDGSLGCSACRWAGEKEFNKYAKEDAARGVAAL